MFRRIRLRLALWYALFLGATLAVLGTALYLAMVQEIYRTVDHQLRSAAETVVELLGTPAEYEITEQHPEEVEEALGTDTLWVYLEARGRSPLRRSPAWALFFPHRDLLAQVVEDGRPRYLTLLTPEGRVFRFYTALFQSGTSQGEAGKPQLEGIIQIARDITEPLLTLRRLLLTLLAIGAGALILAALGGSFMAGRAMQPIMAALKRQREFAADASHELRTPLSIIRTSAELLKDEVGSEKEARELVENIVSESRRMTALVEDLLTLARADSGELELDVSSTDLAQLAREAVERISPLAREKGIAVETHIPPSLPLKGDPRRLGQLLLILLDNAIKYTPPGGQVAVRGERKGHRMEVTVRDTGPGIPPEHQEKVFERFYRIDRARSRREGAGLGLAIARWIVQAHRGQIKLDSEPGKGTTVTVSLPVEGPS